MIKKAVLFLGLTVFAISVSGCNTLFRASKGAAEGAVSGAKKDMEDVKNADASLRKELW